jgi:hypothetical protein
MMNSHYCEGNEHFVLDGAVSPQWNGTGTEDYYLACFWPNPDFDTPLGCVAGNIHEEGGGDLPGAYHVPSSYSSGRKSLDIRLVVKMDDGESAFSDFGYTIYCYR